MDAILIIDQDLVTAAVRSLAISTLSAYQSGTPVKWNDAELAIYLVFIFGEINKSTLLLCLSEMASQSSWVSFSRWKG